MDAVSPSFSGRPVSTAAVRFRENVGLPFPVIFIGLISSGLKTNPLKNI